MAEDQAETHITPEKTTQAKPGEVITPHMAPAQTLAERAEQPVSPPVPVAPSPANLFHPEDDEAVATPAAISADSVSWTASEFIAHEKNTNWYLGLAAAAAALAGLIYLLTKDLISAAVIIFGAVVLGVYGGRQPRQLAYSLNSQALQIGAKHYGLSDFRSFAVVPESAFSSIVFMPLKRFAPAVTIYYAPQDEEKIIGLLSASLPYEEHTPDPLDRFMERIRF